MKKNYLFTFMAATLTTAGIVAATQTPKWISDDSLKAPDMSATAKAPAEDSDIITMYGAVEQSYDPDWNDSQKFGVYSFTNEEGSPLKAAGPVGQRRVSGGGFYYDGCFYFVQGSSVNTGSYVENSFVRMNTETWRVEDQTMHVTPTKTVCEAMAYDYSTETAYAAGLVLNSQKPYMLRTVDLKTGEMYDVAPLEYRFTAIAFDGNGQLWGIARFAEQMGKTYLYKIDKTNGKATLVGDLGFNQKSQYSAATFDLRNGKLYWTTRTYVYDELYQETYTSYVCEIDLNTGKATPVKTLPYEEVISALYIPDCHPKAPEAANDLSFDYAADNTSGKAVCTIPSRAYDRTPLSGSLKVQVLLDGKEVETREGVQPGSKFESDLISMRAGKHTVKVICYNAAGKKGMTSSVQTYGGLDVPAKVNNLTLTVTKKGDTATLTWTAPTVSKNNGVFDESSLTYKVIRRPDMKTVAEGLTECTFTDTPERNMILSQYEVRAVTKDGESDPAYTATARVGSAYQTTYLETFDSQTAFSSYTVIDIAGNGCADGDTFMWHPDYRNAIYWINYNAYNAANCWLVTPTIVLDPEKAYRVSFQTRGYSTSTGPTWGQTRFEIATGDDATAEALDNQIHAEDFITTQIPRLISTIFVPQQDDCRIGFHLTSKGEDHASIDNVRVAEYGSAYIPGMPTGIKASKGDDGITIEATAPTVNAKGQKITELTSIGLYYSGYSTPITKIDNPKPGQTVKLTDPKPTYGDNNYIIAAVNSEGIGLEGAITVNAKPDVPQNVVNMQVATANDGQDAVISWKYPDNMLGANGEKLKESDITYYLYRTSGYQRTLIADGLTETSYTVYDVMKDFSSVRQQKVTYEVVAHTAGGDSNGVQTSAMFGRSYELPIDYNFDNTEFNPWETINANYGGFTLAGSGYDPRVSPASGSGIMTFYVSYPNGWGERMSPRVNLASLVNPRLKFTLYHSDHDGYESSYVKIGVIAEKDGIAQPVDYISDIIRPTGETGWQEHEVDLAKYADCTRASIVIMATSPNRNTNLHFDNIKLIGEKPAYDARVTAIDGPVNAVMGRENIYTVSVNNNGQNDLTDVAVTLTLEDKTIGTKNVNVNEGETVNVQFVYTPALDEQQREAIMTAKATVKDDGNHSNDDAILRMSVVCPNLPYVTDLKAYNENDHVRLAWSDASKYPNAKPESEDFEKYADNIIDNMGEWEMIDVDKANTMAGISSTMGQFTWENCGAPQAYIVFNPVKTGVGTLCTPHSGSRCLVSFTSANPEGNNDWLISPALNDEAQTLSFYVREMLQGYQEVYDVLVSSTGKNMEDFTPVATDEKISSANWERRTYELPEGTRYFAIVCKSQQQFALMLDDFEFIPAQPAVELTGYNVYRDGKVIESGLGETEYNDMAVDPAVTYRYHVTANYSDGESIFSNMAEINLSGVNGVTTEGIGIYGGNGHITVAGAAGKDVAVYTVDGRCIYAFKAAVETESMTMVPGIYVVRAGNTTAKVMVK
ncbi:MAG: choice-of-anchor J domain-containing protein [Muribaculaceae bacterium]|nr:choice-of-anchor J domain-containing protein [Muribaculaceae bacterium]